MLPWYMHYNARDYLARNPPADWMRAYIEQFLEDGIVVVKQGVPRALAIEMKEYFNEVKRLNGDIFDKAKNRHGALQRLVNMHLAFPRLLELFTRNKALAVQDYLFAGKTTLYTSLLFEQGSEQPYHRDTPYFCTRPEYSYFGMWVPMEDIDADNGPLKYFRGGHLLPDQNRMAIASQFYHRLADIADGDERLWLAYQDDVSKACGRMGLQELEAHVEAGDTVIWHPQLPHGGAVHRDKARTRCSLVMHTTPYDTPVYHMDVYFNPDKKVSEKACWKYLRMDHVPEGAGRFYAAVSKNVDIAHKEQIPASRFKLPL